MMPGEHDLSSRCRNFGCDRQPLMIGEYWYCPRCYERLERQRDELLAAAIDAVETFERDGMPGGPILRLRAAIAKANGK